MKSLGLFASFLFLSFAQFLSAGPASSSPPVLPPSQKDSLHEGFAHPPKSAELRCYWWWLNGNTTKETITRDLEGMKAKGYAGAILVDADGSGQQGNQEVPNGPAIGSPQWNDLFVHALKVAQQLGLEISLNVTSRWDVGIIGGATVTPQDALKLLTYSRTTVRGGDTRTVSLSNPPAEDGFYRKIATLAYPLHHGAPLAGMQGSGRTAIRNLRFKTAAEETGFSMPSSDRVMRNAPARVGEQDADIHEVVDVSDRVNAQGVLTWAFPAGTWEILQVGYTDTSKHLTDATGTPLGLPLDVMSASAFDHYWQQAVTPLLEVAKPYVGKSLRYLVTDSWEAGGTNWTDGFRAEFQRRRGYDPLPYLPIVAGRILGSRDTSNRFLFDLRRTVADLIAENYYDRFARYAEQNGLGTHPEGGGPHGAPMDALENFRSTTYPQTEFWAVSGTHRVTDVQRFFVKEAASAAHIYGKPYVAAEGLTSMSLSAWSESPGRNLQPTFDHALTEGLNRLFWHEFTSSPAQYGMPGEEYFAGTHLNPNVTWWNQAGPLLLAFNRAQFLLQQGHSVSDLLYFYGDQIPGQVRVKQDDPARVLPGYDYDVTNEDALLHRIQFSGADLLTPEGLHYRALTLPASRALSYPALQWVSTFLHQGGNVIGLKPLGPLGLMPDDQRAAYAQLANAIWGACDPSGAGETKYGDGHVYCTSDSRAALASMRVAPDFSYHLQVGTDETDTGQAFDYIHRKVGNTDVYFVRSGLNHSVKANLSFRVRGREPELWMPDDGSTRPALVYRETKEDRTEVPLMFPAFGSVFFIFQHASGTHTVDIVRNGSPVYPSSSAAGNVFAPDHSTWVAFDSGSYQLQYSDGSSRSKAVHPLDASAPVLGPWTLMFPAGWGAPQSVPVHQFQSWTMWKDPGVRYFSGTATYRANLHVPEQSTMHQKQIWLDLGSVREIASVVINGTAVQTVWRAPFLVRIDQQIHTGDNEVEIKVTNLWPNRIIGDLQPSDTTHYTKTNVRAYTQDSPLMPSGLLEQVRVLVGQEFNQP